MHVTVLLFAQVADIVGERTVELELPDGATAGNALDALAERYPDLAAMRSRMALAQDTSYCRPDTALQPGRTLALIPPVSGG